MFNKSTLENGLRVVSSPMAQRQSLSLGIWINTGSRYENKQISGISHFLEHLVFKGTKNYTCQQIKQSIEGVGGSFNGFTSEEVTCYLVKMPAKYLDLAFDILSDMVIFPKLAQNDIDRERTVVLEEIKMYKDQPQSHVYELLDQLLWPGHQLGASVLGTSHSVNSINRREMLEYKNSFYTASNIVISAAGALEHENLVKLAARKFNSLNKSEINKYVEFKSKQNKPQADIFVKDTEQSHLAMGFAAFKRGHPLKFALGLLHVMLGANSSSRLFNEIREKRGLAYEIGTQVKYLRDTGAFIIHAGIDNQKVVSTIKLVNSELQRIKTKLVGNNELKRAKDFYLGQLMLALEDTLDQMFWIGESTVSLNKTYTFNEVMQQVEKVRPRDIQEVSRMVFHHGKANLAIIGPLKKEKGNIYKTLKIK